MKRTFTTLERLCAAKGIVCERRGRKIELTTPDGSVTAEADTVADAFADYDSEPFRSLPIKLAKIKLEQEAWQREQDAEARQALKVTALDKLRGYAAQLHREGRRTDADAILGLVQEAEAERARHVAALNKLAQWSDGEQVGAHFDSPWAARIAREALGK